jgi:hypothetical protein
MSLLTWLFDDGADHLTMAMLMDAVRLLPGLLKAESKAEIGVAPLRY